MDENTRKKEKKLKMDKNNHLKTDVWCSMSSWKKKLKK